MTELVTSGSVGGMASNGCLYPEVATHLIKTASRQTDMFSVIFSTGDYAGRKSG